MILDGIDISSCIELFVGFDVVSPQKMDRPGVPLVSISLDGGSGRIYIWNASSDESVGDVHIPAVLDSGATNTQISLTTYRVLIESLDSAVKGGMSERRWPREPWLGGMDYAHRALNATDKYVFSSSTAS